MTEELLAEIKVLKEQLKAYKDIEEELGIDLITFIKAHSLRNDIYYKKNIKSKTIHKSWIQTIVNTKKGVWYALFFGYDYYFRLKDYGKTWALTKEELL